MTTRTFMCFHLLIIIVCLQGTKGANSNNCALGITQNATLASLITDDVKITQLNLEITGFDTNYSSSSNQIVWFKPTRWFLIRGERSNRLLLLFLYYYGLFESFIFVTRKDLHVPIVQTPANCLNSLHLEQKYSLIRSWLINSTSTLDDSSMAAIDEVCSVLIKNELGFGVVHYNCCKTSGGECYDVAEDVWVWTLRAFITIATLFIFFYLPKFIPRAYTRQVFTFISKQSKSIRIVKTSRPDNYKTTGPTIPSVIFKQMKSLENSLKGVPNDIIHTSALRKVDLLLQREQILAETDQAVSFFRLFYDLIIRCKIRHVDSFESCCQASICGDHLTRSNNLTKWFECLNVLKTITVYMLIALPAIPLLYSICADDLEYNELAYHITSRDLQQTSSYYFGPVWGKFLTAILSMLYTAHVIIVLKANSIHEEMAKILEGAIIQSHERSQPGYNTFLKITILPLKRFGLCFVPVLIIGFLLSPFIVVLYIIATSPVMKLLHRQCRNLCRIKAVQFYYNPTTNGPILLAFLTLTLMSVFVIVAIGFNFVLHLLCIAVINILINLSTSMSVVSLCVLLVVYIKDTSNRLAGKYNKYHKVLLGQVLASKQAEVGAEASKTCLDQTDTAFQLTANEFNSTENKPTIGSDLSKSGVTWDIKHGYLRVSTKGLVLFLDKYDVPYIPLKFFNEMTDVICCGCPGTLRSSITTALSDLGKIALFLLFLFILVLAYGDTVYVSPASKLFATIATGLIPLALRSFIFSKSTGPTVDTSTLRFQNAFQEKAVQFTKKWPVGDFSLDFSFCPTKECETFVDAVWKGAYAENGLNAEKPEVDLVFDLRHGADTQSSGITCNCCLNGVEVGAV